MLIEAFTAAKDPARPEANEDRLVILPGRLYAVLDGVSARSPARFEGMLSGQFAAALVQGILERGPSGSGLEIVAALTAALADAATRFCLSDAAPGLRLATTMALVIERGEDAEIVLVGDSGVRIDGGDLHQMTKVLDGITAALRAAAWRRAAGREPAERERLSRAMVMHGAERAEGWAAAEREAVSIEAAAYCAHRFPAVPADLMAELLQGGIVNAQGHHQNNATSPLGYGCLDGTPVPERFIGHFTVSRPRQIELFTDGYFAPGLGFGVAAWEERFAAIEREDPAKVGAFASVKGSTAATWADDRTYLGVSRGS